MLIIREMRRNDDLEAVLKLCSDFFSEYEKHHREFFDTDNLTNDDSFDRYRASMVSDRGATLIVAVI